MKQTVRICISIFVIMSMAALATGCGAGSNQGNGGGGDKEASQKKETAGNYDKPATLVFYSIARDSEATFNERLGNPIRKKFPNLTIKYVERSKANDLEAYISSGEKMDLVWGSLGSWPPVQDLNLAADLSDLIKKHNVDLSAFEPSTIEAMKQMGGGKMLALPFENSTKVIYYNKDIFDKFGIGYPKDGMTWTEMQNLAKKLNREDNGSSYTGYAPSTNSMFIQNEWSLPFFTEAKRSTFNDSSWNKIIQAEFLGVARETGFRKVMDQYRKGGIPNLDTFLKDKVLAMYPEGPLLPLVLPSEMSQVNWNIVAMPTYEEKPRTGYQAYPSYMSIAATSQEKDMAMEVLKFLTSKEFQTALSKTGDMTILKDPEIQKAMGKESKFNGINYGAYFYNKFAPISPKRSVDSKIPAYQEITSKLGPLAKGELDLNTALRQAEEAVNKKVDELNGK